MDAKVSVTFDNIGQAARFLAVYCSPWYPPEHKAAFDFFEREWSHIPGDLRARVADEAARLLAEHFTR
jgi:hypothetical protein